MAGKNGGSLTLLTAAALMVIMVSMVSADKGKNWVVIVAGAKDYKNYFSQANSCHAYHTMVNKGINPDNIIHMSYDDIANDPENPIKGNLVNVPNGTNLYPGCNMDYRQKEVTPEVFLKVLKGDKEGVKQLIGREGKVLDSGPNDNVFVTMVDHGGPGVFFFPGFVKLHSIDLINALKEMYQQKKYKDMLIYVDSCYSGSMFSQMLPDNINIYSTTCAMPDESCYLCCWDKFRKAYVASLYGAGWMDDTDKADIRKRTIWQQYRVMQKSCISSNGSSFPQEYGNLTMNEKVIGQFQGNTSEQQSYKPHVCLNTKSNKEESTFKGSKFTFSGIELENPAIDMVHIATLARRLIESDDLSAEKREELESELRHLMIVKEKAEALTKDLVSAALTNAEHLKEDEILQGKELVQKPQCYKAALRLFSARCPGINMGKYPFARKNLQVFINLCNHQPEADVMAAIMKVTETYGICRAL